MGCCHSTTSAERDDVQPARPARAVAAAAGSRSLQSTASSIADSRRPSIADEPSSLSQQQLRLTGSDRPNKPIRLPSPLRSSPAQVSHLTPPWTRAQLVSERNAFFETRVSGRPEVWNALRLVCELLQQGDVAQAQGILDAADISCSFGRVAAGRGARDRARGGVYDGFGELYELPAWVVTDPRDIIEQEASEQTEKSAAGDQSISGGGGGSDDAYSTDDDDDDDDGKHHPTAIIEDDKLQREEKGKGRAADLGEIVQLRARMSDLSTDVIVSVGKKERVAAIVRKIQEQVGSKRLRLVYLGHVLQEAKTLDAQGYRSGDVVNAYVFEASEDLLRKRNA